MGNLPASGAPVDTGACPMTLTDQKQPQLPEDICDKSTGPRQTQLRRELAVRGLNSYTLVAEVQGSDTICTLQWISRTVCGQSFTLVGHEKTAPPNYDANPIIEGLAKQALVRLWQWFPCTELALDHLLQRLMQLEQKVDRIVTAQETRD